MEEDKLKELIASYDKKLDDILNLNKSSLKKIKLDNTKKQTRFIVILRSIEVFSFSVLALYLGKYIANNWFTTHLVVSGIILHIFTLIALIGSIGQLVLLQQVDYARPIIEIRKKIELVNSHALLFLKLVLLSIPVWWAYPIVAFDYFFNIDLYTNINTDFALKYVVINALLIFPLVWLFNKLTYKNIHLKWVQKTIGFFADTKTKKAIEFLNEIDEFEK